MRAVSVFTYANCSSGSLKFILRLIRGDNAVVNLKFTHMQVETEANSSAREDFSLKWKLINNNLAVIFNASVPSVGKDQHVRCHVSMVSISKKNHRVRHSGRTESILAAIVHRI